MATGSTVNCNGTFNGTVGSDPGANNVTVNVNNGATVNGGGSYAIFLNDNATIQVGNPGAAATAPATLVVNTGASGGGHTGAGFNTIEFNNNTTLVIESNAQVIQNGSTTRTEAVNPLGTNNTIINRGLIQNGQGPAIWFQDTTVSAAQFNTIDNFGTIRTTLRNPDGSLTSVIGATANGTGGAVHFINESSGLVDGNIQFVGGDDQMTLFTGSTITGSIDGGGGTNTMILTGDGTDQLPGTISNFSFLTKTGNSTWTLLGNLVNTGGPLAVDVNQGTLILAANNPNFNGTMMVDAAGILQLGNGGTSGNINANITNNGTVAFDRSDIFAFAKVISGTGGVQQIGSGTTVLTGANIYSGVTDVRAGTLAAGAASVFSPNSVHVIEAGGTLNLAGFDQTVAGVTNAGTILTNGAGPGTALTVAGNYIGAGGIIGFNTFLGTDGSPSDRLVINTGTATGSTTLRINNVGGPGAETLSNGILVVQAVNGAGTAPDAFHLDREVRAGFYTYDLLRGGVNGSDPQDWFLRNEFIVPGPNPEPETPPGTLPEDHPPEGGPLPPGIYPIIGPEIATYGVVQPIARQLGTLTLGTLDERTGNTSSATQACATNEQRRIARGSNGTSPGIVEAPADCALAWKPSAWARTFGESIDNRYHAYADPRASGNFMGFQTGIDLWGGSFIPGHSDAGGFYVAYANADVDASGLVTNAQATGYILQHTGALNLNAWSGGAYWTHTGPGGWYLDGVVQGTRYDGTAMTVNAGLDTTGFGIITSLEGGYPIHLPFYFGPNFVLEPQAQILWQSVHFDQAFDGLGNVALGTTYGTSGRVGLRGQWTILPGSGQVWQPYIRADFWQDWDAEAPVTYSGIDVAELGEKSRRLKLGAGLTAKIDANFSLYGEGSYQFAVGSGPEGLQREAVKGMGGIRYTW